LYFIPHRHARHVKNNTAGTTAGGPATGTGSAEADATTGGRTGCGAGAADWRDTDKPVRDTRSMIVLDGSHKQIVSS